MTSSTLRSGQLLKDVLLACGLSWLLLGVSYLRLWGDSHSAAMSLHTVDPDMMQVWGTALGANLLKFIAAQLALHMTAGLGCLGMAYAAHFAWHSVKASPRHWLLVWFIVMTAWLLLANATWFPVSSMGRTYAEFARHSWYDVQPLDVLSVLCVAAMAMTLWRVFSPVDLRKAGKVVAAACVTGFGTWLAVGAASPSIPRHSGPRPNVILLGMDSLRPDALGKGHTPSIDAFLDRSVVFTDALTPTARTFPSWVSIITGRHPHSTGATTNLMPPHLIDRARTLPDLLDPAGYASFYAIDDVRFSNLDGSFGFDQVVTPPMGASDFLLGFFSDTPLSNMLVSTPLGRLLFPYAHANRAFAVTYEPDTFLDRIDAQLRPAARPQLVVTHLTLAHMPYVWGGQQPLPLQADGRLAFAELYERAVSRLDRQFGDYMEVLRRKELLEDAIVVVLSDHGESLDEPCPPIVPASLMGTDCRAFGHGNNLLATSQYHVVLGVRAFGPAESRAALEPRRVSLPVSLEDVTPTVVDLLGLHGVSNFDGRSLAAALRAEPGVEESFAGRVRFVETEFNPRGFNGIELSRDGMREASSYYHVDPITDRITVRENEMPRIDINRQRGAWGDGRLLYAMPAATGSFRLIYFVPGGIARQLLSPEELQSDPAAAQLWTDLQRRFPDLMTSITFESAEPQLHVVDTDTTASQR